MATTDSAPAAAPPPPTRWAKWRERWQNQGQRVMLQVLALAVIWGLAWFAWGSLNAWGRYQAKQQLAEALATANPAVMAWLSAPVEGLQPMVADPLLLDALQTPLGLASPAAARALAAQAERLGDPDLLLFDVKTGRTLTLPGSLAPAAELLKRLTDLPPTTAKLVAGGTRSGMFYWAWRVPLPEAYQIYALRVQSVRQLAAAWRQHDLPTPMTLTLQLPHAEGTGFWQQTEPLRLTLTEPPAAVAQTAWSRVFPEVGLTVTFLQALPPVARLAKTLVVLWALAASLAVLWPYTAPVRAALWAKLGPRLLPLLQRLEVLWNRVGGGQALATLLAKLMGRAVGLIGRARPEPEAQRPAWETKTVAAAQPIDLVAGPGAYSAADFGRALPNNRPLLKPKLKPLAPKEALAATAPQPEPEPDPDVLKDRIMRCIRQGLVELLYQPMYRNSDNAVEGNEVLARLADVSGVIAPGQFLPVLGAMGQVSALDALVFEKVIEQHFAAGRSPTVMLSLNISGTSLEDLGYLRDVAKRGPNVLKHLMFEVRSNEVVRDPNALQLLKALQRQGARVAVDYFGGGSAMVEASKALGIDYIKMDMMRFTSSGDLRKEFQDVCSLAERLKLPVVVEKIEDKETQTLARQAGATLLQGYGLSKPGSSLITLPLDAKL
ncbi:MAG: EAL domain-containing protein [Alphaproteobacteria bacterium]|nr:EAL domain-containing protein [Alphaproteobacteria bacterium]